jgi:geranylgeranyl diphosphate synthase type II
VAELAKAAGACQLVGGQEDDLKAEFAELSSNRAQRLEQLEAIHRRKTGAMIRVSLRLGGIIGQATDKQLAALDAYGERLGLAFQIVDDLLDREGTAAALGKRTKKDHDHGKLTFPALLGSDESRRRANELVAGAIDSVGIFGPKSEPLVALAKYVIERDH